MKHDPELTRLLLLNLRDGGHEDQINKYPADLVLEQQARLIDDGLATGNAIKDGLKLRWVKGLCISSGGHHFLEARDISGAKLTTSPPSLESLTLHKTQKRIFVSHSAVDKDLADALLDMLCAALPLRVSDFVCTSVDGAKLRGGEETGNVLRQAIRDVPAFLSILTPKAVASTYVLFELGARWGTERYHIPLLAKGAGPEMLKEPLKATNALRLYHEPDVLQLVDDIANVLHFKSEPPQNYHQKMVKVVEISRTGSAITPPSTDSITSRGSFVNLPSTVELVRTRHAFNNMALSEAAKKLLVAASDSIDGNVSKTRSMDGEIVNIHAPDQEFMGDIQDKRARALWLDAFNELVRVGCFAPTSHDGIYTVTHTGYQIADILKR